MEKTPIQQESPQPGHDQSLIRRKPAVRRFITYKHMVLLIFTVILLLGSFIIPQKQSDALAAKPGPGNVCNWHLVAAGDTLDYISASYRTNIGAIVRANRIRNINLIYAGQRLCIPYAANHRHTTSGFSGLLPDGHVRWYARNALEQSNRRQVVYLLRQAAAQHGLPINLVLAIAWQESGWRHHVIARDGGIGVMQIMPYTALSLDRALGVRYDPYKLRDNIELGTYYIRLLWSNFHGNLNQVISAYNEGGWNVRHRGIFNWRYVANVKAIMWRY